MNNDYHSTEWLALLKRDVILGVSFFFFFFYKRFMPNAKVTYSSRVLIQGMQPKDKETRDREKT